MRITTNDAITFQVITSSIRKYPKIIPKIGIKYATWVWKTKPLTVNILNLISQAKPVAITPKYSNEIVETKVGEEFQGVSIINEKGKRKITDHKVVDVVTF